MRRLLTLLGLGFLYVGCIPVLALIAAYLSAFIVVGKDYSAEATVGMITLRGFPVWFLETAPGISIMSSWHFARFGINFGIWFLLLLCAGIATHVMIKKKGSIGIGTPLA
jgi:hypothetical protein